MARPDQWQKRWRIVLEYIRPYIRNNTLSGVYFGDELMGQGLPLSNLTAAVKYVRSSWPTAMLAYNEDVCAMTGYSRTGDPVSDDPNWRLPTDLDFFSVDYCELEISSDNFSTCSRLFCCG